MVHDLMMTNIAQPEFAYPTLARELLRVGAANFTTLAHFSVSSTMSFSKAAGEPPRTVWFRSAYRALMPGLTSLECGVEAAIKRPLVSSDLRCCATASTVK